MTFNKNISLTESNNSSRISSKNFYLHNEVNLAMEHNYYIHKFLNKLMIDGKKSKAFKIMNEAFDIILNKNDATSLNEQDVFHLFLLAIENVTPYLDVRKVRKSGTTLLVPYAITPERGIYNAFCWLIKAAREKRRRRKFSYYLAEEIMLASQKTGKAREKRNELHKIALANRSNTKYRWW